MAPVTGCAHRISRGQWGRSWGRRHGPNPGYWLRAPTLAKENGYDQTYESEVTTDACHCAVGNSHQYPVCERGLADQGAAGSDRLQSYGGGSIDADSAVTGWPGGF